jgi:hypothetical protein
LVAAFNDAWIVIGALVLLSMVLLLLLRPRPDAALPDRKNLGYPAESAR